MPFLALRRVSRRLQLEAQLGFTLQPQDMAKVTDDLMQVRTEVARVPSCAESRLVESWAVAETWAEATLRARASGGVAMTL